MTHDRREMLIESLRAALADPMTEDAKRPGLQDSLTKLERIQTVMRDRAAGKGRSVVEQKVEHRIAQSTKAAQDEANPQHRPTPPPVGKVDPI